MIVGRTLLRGFTGLAVLALGVAAPADAQTGQNEQAAGGALGRRVEGSMNGAAPTGDLRISSRLRTRLETRLQTRIERFSPERADARFAYRMPIDDGSRRQSTNMNQQSMPPAMPDAPPQSVTNPQPGTPSQQ